MAALSLALDYSFILSVVSICPSKKSLSSCSTIHTALRFELLSVAQNESCAGLPSTCFIHIHEHLFPRLSHEWDSRLFCQECWVGSAFTPPHPPALQTHTISKFTWATTDKNSYNRLCHGILSHQSLYMTLVVCRSNKLNYILRFKA